MARVWRRVALVTGLAAVTALYVVNLGGVPAALTGDEVEFGNHGLSIARTGHDLNGRPLPLLVQITDPLTPDITSPYWYQPFLFYLIAVFVKVLPFSEWSIRLPVALIGVLNTGLTYAVGRRAFGRVEYGLLSAGILALTPAHYIMSRQALDYIGPLPFVLGWLWCVIGYLDDRRSSLAAAGALLGAGTFSYVAAWALTPLFLGLTIAVVWARGGRWRETANLVGGFAAPIAVAAPWLVRHPDPLLSTLTRYHGLGAEHGVAYRLSLYWDYFSPSFLFFAGGNDPTQTTSRAGVFLLPLSVLLIAGFIQLLRRRDAIGVLLIAGFALAPLPIVIALPESADYSIARALLLVPFGSLIASEGARMLFSHHRVAGRLVAIALLAGAALQFSIFARDYFGDYAARSLERFDRSDSRGLGERLVALVDEQATPAIYLEGNTGGRASRWLFFVNAHGRPELWERTHYADAAGPSAAAPGSLRVIEGTSGPTILRRTNAQTWIAP